MALRDELATYSVCEIRPVDESMEDLLSRKGTIYAAKIIKINPDDTIDFSIPTFMGEHVDLQRNTRYSFLFIHNQSMKTAHGVFLQRIRVDNVPMAKVKLVTQIKKIQRRDYYRLGCRVNMLFQVIRIRKEELLLPNHEELAREKLDDDSWKEGEILDISGGGMKFISEAPIMDFPFLYMTFFLQEDVDYQSPIEITGRLLSRQPVPRSLMCTHRVQFVPEHSKSQDRILAYVYKQQLKVARGEQM